MITSLCGDSIINYYIRSESIPFLHFLSAASKYYENLHLLYLIHCCRQILIADFGKFFVLHRFRKLHINRHFSKHRDSKLFCYFVNMALAKYRDLLPSVRTYKIAVILYDSQYWYIHLSGHIICFLHDHLHKILWR